MSGPAPQPIVGVVLAGGLSRRMGGTDKTLISLGGKPMIGHVLERLAPQVGDVAINANGDTDRFKPFSVPVIEDSIQGYKGPLAGILTAMRWARRIHRATHVVTTAADTPFLPADLVLRFRQCATGRETIAMAISGSGRHPVFALWPTSLAEDLESWLKETDTLKVTMWTRRHECVDCSFAEYGDGSDPFFNVNTPDDLAAAETILRGKAQ